MADYSSLAEIMDEDRFHPDNYGPLSKPTDELPTVLATTNCQTSASLAFPVDIGEVANLPATSESMESPSTYKLFVTPEPEDFSFGTTSRRPYATRHDASFMSTEAGNIKVEPENLHSPSRRSELRSHSLAGRVPDSPSASRAHDEDEGDDCMIVEENFCSIDAQKKWREKKRKRHIPIIIDDNEPIIKTENGVSTEAPNPIEIQRTILELFNTQMGATTADSEAQNSAKSPSPTLRPLKRAHRKTRVEDGLDMKLDLDTLMRTNNEDTSWMHENFDESDELDGIGALKHVLEERKREQGRLSEVDTIELMRLERQIALAARRKQVAHRDQSPDDFERSVMVSDEEDHMSVEDVEAERSDHRLSQMAREIRASHLRRTGEPQKPAQNSNGRPRRKAAKTAREVEEMRREKAREKERRKRARSASPFKGCGNGKRANQKKGGKPSKSKKNKSRVQTGLEGGTDEALEAMLADLKHNDIVADRQAQENLGDAPVINETSKDKQIKALLASVPADYDTHRTKIDRSDLVRASNRFGQGMVKPCNGKWKLKGMKSSLYHHQLLAADWMVSRELGVDAPHGGLLADVMGLGKTLETLATMVGNPPSNEDIWNRRKTTLIVLPSSAIKQWAEEITTHVEEKVFPRVMHYKASKEIPIVSIQDCDIVLTSYAEVMMSFPFPSEEDIAGWSDANGYKEWQERYKMNAGDLHKISWYRIVLDEAHAIKNFQTRTSLACQSLKGQYRWALSGTPIQNRLDELFPYFRFLRAPWTNDYEEFVENFCDPDSKDNNRRISVILSIVMRRTMKDKILGRHIVDLPPIHPETQYISFSREEQVLYRALEDRFREHINHEFKKGTAKYNYHYFLVFLLRLRQCTAHPFLLEETLEHVLEPSDFQRIERKLERLARYRVPFYGQLKLWVQQTAQERQEADERGEPNLAPGEKVPFGVSDFGKHFRMGNFLKNLKPKELITNVVCLFCTDLARAACITDCKHIFCKECMNNYIKQEELNGKSKILTCPNPSCKKILESVLPYKDLNLQNDDEASPDDTDDISLIGDQGPRRKFQRKSRSSLIPDPYPGPSKWLNMYKLDKKKYLLPSAKTTALKAQILKWIDENPEDKIIVFTQFRMMAKIIGLICEEEKWGYQYFTGNMTTDQRHNAVKAFHTLRGKRILIANLKCGGQSLNLTCANRIISIDLWWNHSVEQQAFGRVFRIGQQKDTYVSRFVIKKTVDTRILDLQAQKINAIDRALQDVTEGCSVEALNIRDLVSLFGRVTNEDGVTQVVRDYDDDEEDEEEVRGRNEDEVVGEGNEDGQHRE